MTAPRVIELDISPGTSNQLYLQQRGLSSEVYLYDIVVTFLPDNGSIPLSAMTYIINGLETPQVPLGRFYSFELSGAEIITFWNNDTANIKVLINAFYKETPDQLGGSSTGDFRRDGSVTPTDTRNPLQRNRVFNVDWRKEHQANVE